ncbi:unnamed protein product [Rotaria sordida]|uniref:Orn/DAP/Arg decarboxylase 2 N-terminal domain-containing protein n=1 Tax=Rotaria sordida TaxID=392033 RepID=A0A818FK17_9BILA|nr:unnamed protein product [Rotaria sordida]CAF0809671.1 unnamed protein product [Rotaria sordida]CAF1008226.1 unnamed protein product [Rotaria sordida]CAF3476739.1 unnamed protein product [Rotaria sordida]CAF3537725.1 unnamed protein product [Rotaria sordida]
MNSEAFVDTIRKARQIINHSNQLAFDMNLMDIDGGFLGNVGTDALFKALIAAINCALDKHFLSSCGVQIIAEPAYYYVASAENYLCWRVLFYLNCEKMFNKLSTNRML